MCRSACRAGFFAGLQQIGSGLARPADPLTGGGYSCRVSGEVCRAGLPPGKGFRWRQSGES